MESNQDSVCAFRYGCAEQKNIKMNDAGRWTSDGWRYFISSSIAFFPQQMVLPYAESIQLFFIFDHNNFPEYFCFHAPPQSPATFPRLKGKKKSHHQCHRSISSSDSCNSQVTFIYLKKNTLSTCSVLSQVNIGISSAVPSIIKMGIPELCGFQPFQWESWRPSKCQPGNGWESLLSFSKMPLVFSFSRPNADAMAVYRCLFFYDEPISFLFFPISGPRERGNERFQKK